MLGPLLQTDDEEPDYYCAYLPGDDDHIRAIVGDSIAEVKYDGLNALLFGESTFRSLICHNHPAGRIEELIQKCPYQIPTAANSGWHPEFDSEEEESDLED